MKPKFFFPWQNQTTFAASAVDAAGANPVKTEAVASTAAVAQQAYFRYLREGSIPGHEEQHWLAAEAELFLQIVRETAIPPHQWLLACVDEGSALTRRYYG